MTSEWRDNERARRRASLHDFFLSHRDWVNAGSTTMSPGACTTQTWQDIAGELGLPALPVPVQVAGAGMAAAAVVLEELGRSLCPSPLLPSMIAT